MSSRDISIEYRAWRLDVLRNGGRKCAECGSVRTLHCHHIKTWDEYPELRFDVSNGMVLCKECHIARHPFMTKYKDKKRRTKKLPKAERLKNYLKIRLQAAIKREKKFNCKIRYAKR